MDADDGETNSIEDLKVLALVIAAGSAVAAAGRLFEVDAAVMALGPAILLVPFWLLGVGWKLLRSDSLYRAPP